MLLQMALFPSLMAEQYSIVGFSGDSVVKNLPAIAGDGDLIPGLEKEMATHSSSPAWKISWKEEPGGLQSMDMQKSQTQFSD